MKRQPATHRALRNACHAFWAAALASAVLALTLAPFSAHAAPQPAMESTGVYVTILSPNPGASFDGDGKQIEVSAFYQAPLTTGGVSVLELYIDGTKQADKKLDSPETRGVVSFLISPGTLTPGPHQIVVRVSAMDAEIASARTSLSLKGQAVNTLGETIPLTAPHVFIASPAPEATVSGTVAIKVNANDDSGKPPYVSLFVDHAFKTLRNFPPFDFEWDTTHVSNGYHTIEVWGYNDAQLVGHAEPLRILVNNPGGRTFVRHDLSDVVTKSAAVKPSIIKPVAPKTRVIGLNLVKPSAQKMTLKPQVVIPRRAALAAPVLASGKAMTVKATPQRLAAARTSDLGLDDATSLMVPFLRSGAHIAPVVKAAPAPKSAPIIEPIAKATAAKPVVSVKPAAASPAAPKPVISSLRAPRLASMPDAPNAPIQLAAGGPVNSSDLTTDTELAAPFLRAAVPGHAGASRSARAPIVTVPAKAASLDVPKTAPAPSMPMPLRIASATTAPSDLFNGDSTLQTPALSGAHLAPVPVTHKLMVQHDGVKTPVTAIAVTSERAILRARGSYQVVLNDRLVSLDKPLAERSSILFAPFRQIFESSGGSLAWLAGSKTVHAVSSTKDIEITIGSRQVLINNQPERLTISPYLQTGRTMVPLSFLPLALDVTVNFDPITGHVVINSKD